MLARGVVWASTMDDLERSLRCEACGAVWKSPAAHQIALRDGKCLRCGGGPLIDELTGEVAHGTGGADDEARGDDG